MIFRGWSIPIFQGLSRSPCRVTAAVISPVFYSLRYHKPRISAPKAVPPADNFLQKQQKQRDLSPRSGPVSACPPVGGDHVTAEVVEIAAARTAGIDKRRRSALPRYFGGNDAERGPAPYRHGVWRSISLGTARSPRASIVSAPPARRLEPTPGTPCRGKRDIDGLVTADR